MNEIPIMWATELKDAYPAKSGPVGWASVKLLLALRRALTDSTWLEIIDGCKRYKAYCEASGREGTEFVQSPLRFISDGCHLEQFEHKAPPTKEQAAKADHDRRVGERMDQARAAGGRLSPPLEPFPREPVAAFETRIALAKSVGKPGPIPADIRARISQIANRMRIAK